MTTMTEAERLRLCDLIERCGFDPNDVPRDGVTEHGPLVTIETFRRDDDGHILIAGDEFLCDRHIVKRPPDAPPKS